MQWKSGRENDPLGRYQQSTWLAFARTGNPGSEGLGKWPVYGQRRETMMLGQQSGVQEAPFEEEPPFVDSVSNFIKYKPDIDFLKDNPFIP